MLWRDYFQKVASADYQPSVIYRDWLRSSKTALGPTTSLQGWGIIKAWFDYSLQEEYKKVRLSNSQTFIISGNLDVATPSNFATEKLLPALPHGNRLS